MGKDRPHEKTCPDLPKDTLGAIELAAEARKLLNSTDDSGRRIREPTKDEIEQAKAKFAQAREWDNNVVWGDEWLIEEEKLKKARNMKKIYHTVKRGEILSRIAVKYGYNFRDIAMWNNIKPPYILKIGQKLLVSPPIQKIE